MRKLTDFVLDRLDDNLPDDEQRIPIPDTALTGTYYGRGVTVFQRGETVVAVSQNGMLHEALAVFEEGLDALLAIDELVEPGYALDSTAERFNYPDEAPMPAAAAVWLKRMPGPFRTDAPTMFTPERVRLPAIDDFSASGVANEFMHVMYAIQRVWEYELSTAWREPRWRLVPAT